MWQRECNAIEIPILLIQEINKKMEIPLCIMWQCECNAIKAIRFKKSTKYCCHHVQFIERKYLHYNVVGIILKY
jgi:hypothetical protein